MVLVGMSQTSRSHRLHVARTLWLFTCSKKACSSGQSISQKPKLSSYLTAILASHPGSGAEVVSVALWINVPPSREALRM